MSESGKGDDLNDEERTLKKILDDAKMYEENMTVAYMKEVVGVICASRNMVNEGGQNKDVNKSPELMRQDLTTRQTSQRSNSKGSERGSTIPDSDKQMKKNISQEKRGESSDESLHSKLSTKFSDKENRGIHSTNMNKGRSSVHKNSSDGVDNKQSGQGTNSQMARNEMPKWEINPWDTSDDARDLSLKPRFVTSPEKDCAEDGTSFNFDKALAHLRNYLRQTAEFWHIQHGSFVKSQGSWGKAIQVGTENGSLDKESIADGLSEDAGSSETIFNIDTERKRRSCAIKTVKYTADEFSESNSDGDFEQALSSKRRKPTKRAGSSENTNLPKETTGRVRNLANRDDIHASEEMNDESSDAELQKNVKKKKSNKWASSSEKTSLTKETDSSETKRKRTNVTNRDDVYEWEAIIDEDSDEELQKSAKKRKLTKRAGSSGNTRSSKETSGSETPRRLRNINNGEDSYEEEAVKEERDSDEEIQRGARRMKSSKSLAVTKKGASTRPSRRMSVEPVSSNALEKQDDAPVCIDDSDEIMISDNEESSETVQNPRRNRSEEAVSSTSSSYPRRIIPPIPKGRFSGIKARKPLFGYSNQARGKKQSNQVKDDEEEVARTNYKGRSHGRGNNSGHQDSEITEVLKNIDEEEVVAMQVNRAEIRPLRISNRMKLQQERLKSLRKEEEQSEMQRAEEQRIKEEQSQREKEERIKQRVREQNQKVKRDEQTARAKAHSETHWKMLMEQQGKKRQVERTELNPEGPRQNSDVPTVEVLRENHFETELNDVEELNDDRRSGKQHSKLVPCPICGKKFSIGQIEDHAASCEEYDSAYSAGASRSNSPALSMRSMTPVQCGTSTKTHECMVCSLFSSTDGRKYEEHVSICIPKHRNGKINVPSKD